MLEEHARETSAEDDLRTAPDAEQFMSQQANLSLLQRLLGLSILAAFVVLSLASIHTVLPQPDEAVYANPGYNLVYNGHLGTTVCELRSFMPLSMAHRTYWQPPLYFVVTAAWFKIAGFGVFQVRILSMLFGLMGLIAWYWIVQRLSGSAGAGLLAMALISVDFFFVLSASEGRMDMMCAGLGAASLAAYLLLRERSFVAALFLSHVFATLSILAHPVGVLYWLGLVFLIGSIDRASLSFRKMGAALAPCLTGVVLWGMFILRDPGAFFEQMHTMVTVVKQSFDGPGLSTVPVIRSVQLEWRNRYLGPFGMSGDVAMAHRLKAVVLLAYMAAMAGILLVKRVRRQKHVAKLGVLTLMSMLYLALGSPSKYYYYLPHITAFMAAGLGTFLYSLSVNPKVRFVIVTTGLLAIGGLQMAGSIYRISQNQYQRSFLPATEYIRRNSASQSVIMGSSELWFALEHDRYVISDPNLGALSGTVPDVFVMDSVYRNLHERTQRNNPFEYEYVRRMLDTSRLVYQDLNYRIYLRH